jgi:hypothetical protein
MELALLRKRHQIAEVSKVTSKLTPASFCPDGNMDRRACCASYHK